MNHQTQRDRILALLREPPDRDQGWVPLPCILALGIAQYNARIFELRGMGHEIENRKKKLRGQVHSWFRLMPKQSEFKLGREGNDP